MQSRSVGDWLPPPPMPPATPAELAGGGGVKRQNTPATEAERRGSGIGGGLEGKSKLRITPVVD